MSASVLNDNISPRIYRVIETVLIAGIVLGIFGMFQPWLIILYKVWIHCSACVHTGFHLVEPHKAKGRKSPERCGQLIQPGYEDN